MTRTERRAARLAVIAAEREKRPRAYAKHAARLLNLTPRQVRRIAEYWGLTCPKK